MNFGLGRSRRSLRESFIVPGTKWCGAGQLAEDYTELGSSITEDRCCRAHDSCRRNIGMFKRKYGYFNFRPFTISHCRCDRRSVSYFYFFTCIDTCSVKYHYIFLSNQISFSRVFNSSSL